MLAPAAVIYAVGWLLRNCFAWIRTRIESALCVRLTAPHSKGPSSRVPSIIRTVRITAGKILTQLVIIPSIMALLRTGHR